MGSTAITSYIHPKLTWRMLYIQFFKADLKWSQADQDKLGHPQRPRQAQPREYSNYKLCSSEIDMVHIIILFFKDK